MMPRIPCRQEVNLLFFGLGRGLDLKRRDADSLGLDLRLPVHGHVDQKGQSVANGEGLFNSTRILRKTLVSTINGSILPRSGDDDAANTTEVGVVNFNIQNLAGDVRDDGVGRAKVDPRADDCRVSVDSSARKHAGILGRQRR